MDFSWFSKGTDQSDDDGAESSSCSEDEIAQRSMYSVLRGSRTGDLIVFTPRDKRDICFFIGVVVCKQPYSSRRELLVVTEIGTFEAMSFIMDTNKYYLPLYLIRKKGDNSVLCAYFNSRIKCVQDTPINSPLRSSVTLNRAFINTSLKIALDGKVVNPKNLLAQLESIYKEIVELRCMYQMD